ncbi:MAG: Tagatose-bisphosphate aldolase [Candidatus Yanofskybacteria bacterium GW2011_GWF1_44_227]|uniref:Tagatose-bisphosphate aldolase n=1 Tax=Candidatus Yanofskybacteria bacterium GW2011_GWE2_40_11 TaxID=1619033 RepID=A0A0G0QK53_9BACT|nr:MAG: Tagatose-bisphosphate aldolase [Candidatus Yanofskybacteria bacterium GW2011_GWE1_40_10]KKR40528.1 MAG: Tagatose-bisphosphate aldolase [Candidatus Yanofskybacteria bacterium GW2011_GWE2_40_11]KKT15171.1 MAG: Tagatose-bisphosphate aldolase [Candidatus Yanofskybacteria bacterium GW2011_GWF2_43_596]KKT52796.1 MAG: Tagatose-bisphosphate aldolase [Candidatus Yanofskybacteria bacterium GW2011_GWF1_44_227]OGN35474.1 MAG: hypothetical protein A2207_01915 [Candidatus Yanofskybacteria bacterium R
MENLNYYLKRAREKGQAIGHFNFVTEDVLKTIILGAKESGAEAVMVGTSEGEANFIGLREAVAMVGALRIDLEFPVFLNADHFKSFEKCREAMDAGYDSIIMDGSHLSNSDNIDVTKKVVDYAKSLNMAITVEGEIGYMKGSSQVQDKIEISPADFTKPEEAKDFVEKTGVDRLAIVFGNIHGIVTQQEERLDIAHLKNIISAMPSVFYVLHGASGLDDDDIRAAIEAGISNIHFNTELRVAYKEGIDDAIHAQPGEVTPYKYLAAADEEVKKVVMAKTKLFLGL